MNKTLFEKLTRPGETITLKESVVANIDHILSAGGLLDATLNGEINASRQSLGSIFVNGLSAIVDQSSNSPDQLQQYRTTLRKVLLRFEPRLKNVTVNSISGGTIQSSCQLKIELIDGEFEHQFVFGNS